MSKKNCRVNFDFDFITLSPNDTRCSSLSCTECIEYEYVDRLTGE